MWFLVTDGAEEHIRFSTATMDMIRLFEENTAERSSLNLTRECHAILLKTIACTGRRAPPSAPRAGRPAVGRITWNDLVSAVAWTPASAAGGKASTDPNATGESLRRALDGLRSTAARRVAGTLFTVRVPSAADGQSAWSVLLPLDSMRECACWSLHWRTVRDAVGILAAAKLDQCMANGGRGVLVSTQEVINHMSAMRENQVYREFILLAGSRILAALGFVYRPGGKTTGLSTQGAGRQCLFLLPRVQKAASQTGATVAAIDTGDCHPVRTEDGARQLLRAIVALNLATRLPWLPRQLTTDTGQLYPMINPNDEADITPLWHFFVFLAGRWIHEVQCTIEGALTSEPQEFDVEPGASSHLLEWVPRIVWSFFSSGVSDKLSVVQDTSAAIAAVDLFEQSAARSVFSPVVDSDEERTWPDCMKVTSFGVMEGSVVAFRRTLACILEVATVMTDWFQLVAGETSRALVDAPLADEYWLGSVPCQYTWTLDRQATRCFACNHRDLAAVFDADGYDPVRILPRRRAMVYLWTTILRELERDGAPGNKTARRIASRVCCYAVLRMIRYLKCAYCIKDTARDETEMYSLHCIVLKHMSFSRASMIFPRPTHRV